MDVVGLRNLDFAQVDIGGLGFGDWLLCWGSHGAYNPGWFHKSLCLKLLSEGLLPSPSAAATLLWVPCSWTRGDQLWSCPHWGSHSLLPNITTHRYGLDGRMDLTGMAEAPCTILSSSLQVYTFDEELVAIICVVSKFYTFFFCLSVVLNQKQHLQSIISTDLKWGGNNSYNLPNLVMTSEMAAARFCRWWDSHFKSVIARKNLLLNKGQNYSP